jgi:ribosome assembly protein 4
MSVPLPPPKRQKLYHGIPEPENPQISEESVPNVVVQFVNDQDGSPLAPAVNLPANVTKDALEALVNKLRPQVSLPPYGLVFHLSPHPLLLPGR